MKHVLWVEIDIRNIHHNLNCVRKIVGHNAHILAVVKANAYGHGMVEVAQALANDVAYFAVSTVTEGAELRASGIMVPILILGATLPDHFYTALDHDLSFSVSDVAYATVLARTAQRRGKHAKVHIKVDTGMGRWGLAYRDAFLSIQRIVSLPSLDCEGLFTHFPTADNKVFDYTERQIELFNALIDELKKKHIVFRYYHAANSAGLTNFARSHYNLVRPGLMMYGYFPNEQITAPCSLKPVLSLKGCVMSIKEFRSGRGVGYGRRFITPAHTRIAIIPIGYGHGYPYALSQKGLVLIKGRRYPIAGTVSMDYIMVDLGMDDQIKIGDLATIIGIDGEQEISVHELAQKANTIPYDILTGLSARIPRVYRRDGSEITEAEPDDRDEA